MSLVRLRGGDESLWDAADPILAAQETGVVPGGGAKVGDGVRRWSELPWIGDSGACSQYGAVDGGTAVTVSWPDGSRDGAAAVDTVDGGLAGTVTFGDGDLDGGTAATVSYAATTDGGLAYAGAPAEPTYTGTLYGGRADTEWCAGATRGVRLVSVSGAVDEFDDVLVCSGTITLTLPTVSSIAQGRVFDIKNVDTGLVTITATDLIDGETSQACSRWESLTLLNTGTEWVTL